MNPVFLDTVGLIALWDTADQWHAAAAPVFLQLVASGRALVTTTLVLFECGNAAARRPYRTAVDDLRVWLTARGQLIEPTASDLDTAWADYRAGHPGSAGIVDWQSASKTDPHRQAKRTHQGSGVHLSGLVAYDQLATLLLSLGNSVVTFWPPGETELGSAGTQPNKG